MPPDAPGPPTGEILVLLNDIQVDLTFPVDMDAVSSLQMADFTIKQFDGRNITPGGHSWQSVRVLRLTYSDFGSLSNPCFVDYVTFGNLPLKTAAAVDYPDFLDVECAF